eukprot:COSAG01_NODE_18684_length_1060_cov_1.236212_2_plen_85_part_00
MSNVEKVSHLSRMPPWLVFAITLPSMRAPTCGQAAVKTTRRVDTTIRPEYTMPATCMVISVGRHYSLSNIISPSRGPPRAPGHC